MALGALLVLVALFMETTVGGFYNLGLLHQQGLFLTLGCALFLGGLVLFGVWKLRQTREEEAQERAAATTRKNKFLRTVEEWKAHGNELVEELEARRQPLERPEPPRGSKQVELKDDTSDFTGGWMRAIKARHVLLVGAVAIGLTVLFPPYSLTDYSNGGVAELVSVRSFIGDGPKFSELYMERWMLELIIELGVMWIALVVCSRAKKKAGRVSAAQSPADR